VGYGGQGDDKTPLLVKRNNTGKITLYMFLISTVLIYFLIYCNTYITHSQL
jgi:hypothetical protein